MLYDKRSETTESDPKLSKSEPKLTKSEPKLTKSEPKLTKSDKAGEQEADLRSSRKTGHRLEKQQENRPPT